MTNEQHAGAALILVCVFAGSIFGFAFGIVPKWIAELATIASIALLLAGGLALGFAALFKKAG
jgi:hypothetical protein